MRPSRFAVALCLLAASVNAVAQSQPPGAGRVWEPEEDAQTWGRVSPDGRYLPYGRGGDLHLYVRDFLTNTTRRLTTRRSPGGPSVGIPGDDIWAFSPDSSMLAYSWAIDGREELRLIDMREANPQPRSLLTDPDIRFVTAWGWTPDAKSIVVGIWRRQRQDSELGLVDIASRSLRVLVRVPTAAANNQGPTAISPDGRFIAYSPRQGATMRDLVLLPLDGGKPMPLLATAAEEAVVGWSRDSRELAYVTTSGNKQSIHAVRVNGDGTAGSTRILLPDLQNVVDDLLGMTNDGSLMVRSSDATRWRASVASIDLQTGRVLTRAAEIKTASAQTELQPDHWSSDGRQLVLRTAFDDPPEHLMIIRDHVTGQDRRLQSELWGFQRLFWLPDGRSLVTRGSPKPQPPPWPVYRVDVVTGKATEIAPQSSAVRGVTSDGRIVFELTKPPEGSGEGSLVEHNTSSAAQRTLHTWSGGDAGRQSWAIDEEATILFHRSPDRAAADRHRLIAKDLRSGKESVLIPAATIGAVTSAAAGRFVLTSVDGRVVLVPATGGKPIDVPRVGGVMPEILLWASDGRAFLGRTIARTPRAAGSNRSILTAQYWWVPIDGRMARPIDAGIGPYAGGFVAHGNQVAFAERSGPGFQPIRVHVLPRLFDGRPK